MASIVVEGFSDMIQLMEMTASQTKRICGRALYPGAEIVADICKRKLENLKTDDQLFRITEKFGDLRSGPTTRQKKFLIESMGIARMRKTRDGWDVKLGFDGYNDIVSDRWPNGQPNAVIARSVNKGTSFMRAQPFMEQSIKEGEKACIAAIEKAFDEEIDKIYGR